jgi:hypothetical protein
MSSSQYNYITASISAPMDMKFVYKAEEMVFSGWQAVDSKQNTNESVAAFRLLTNLKQDTSIKCKKILKFTWDHGIGLMRNPPLANGKNKTPEIYKLG